MPGRHSLAMVAVLCLAAPATAQNEKADRVFVNGRVWTGDERLPMAEALAVRGPTLLAVGTTKEVMKRAEKRGTDVVDLKGRLVVPGFNDAHIHFMGGSLALQQVDLHGAWSVEEVQRRIAAFGRSSPDKPWVTGRGWAYGAFPGGLPHKKWLDAAVPDRPAFIVGYDGHTAWCNSAALLAGGITRATKDPKDGLIVRDESGEPTGVLKEGAMELVARMTPKPDAEEKYRALKKGLELAASYGLTSVQNASFDEADLPVFERVLQERGMKVRFYWAVPFVRDPSPETLARYAELREKHRSPVFRFGAAKAMVDGVVEAQTAAMFEPYARGGTGLPSWTQEELNRTAALYDKERFQIFLHAIGDKAIHMALNAYEHAARTNGTTGRRHRVEHVEVLRAEDLPRFKTLGVVASTQAIFVNPDKNHLEVYVPTLGPQRSALALAFKSIDDAGAVQAFGSDWPVFSCDVLKGLYAAVTRTTPQGAPAGGWRPEQRLSVEAALRHFTRDAAYASLEESAKGTLTAGKLADFVVLSDDILAPPVERILKTKVMLTVMGGQDTYRSPER
jgi:predicted amidohydrolase YtcJ